MPKHTMIRRGLTGALVVGAAGFAPAAQARFEFNPSPLRTSVPAGAARATTARQTAASAQAGFQWGDAGVGAAGAAALLGAGAAASVAVRRRRTQHTAIG